MTSKNLISFSVTVLTTWLLLIIGRVIVPQISTEWTANDFIDYQLKYQLLTAVLAVVFVAVLRLIRPNEWGLFMVRGTIDAPATKNTFFGISEGESWKKIGWTFSLLITLVTAVVVWLQVVHGHQLHVMTIGWICIPLLAAVNAAVEESITRFGVVISFFGASTSSRIAVISGIVFGSVHYFGTPGGVLGVGVAGILGWLLARSVLETRGMFWAWWIHFLQDIIILTALYLVS